MNLPDSSPYAGSVSHVTRRGFLRTVTASSVVFALPKLASAAVGRLKKPVRIGAIADLHQDVMHDGIVRMNAYVKEMARRNPDAIMQLGDFACPKAKNKEVIDTFNQAHERSLHVIGNHDMDAGCTKQQCLDVWEMPGRYYAQNIEGLSLLVLDGNDKGSPTHKGGYVSYIGDEQRTWLKEQLKRLDGPVIVASHQPLAGVGAVDNAREIQGILSEASDKVILAINGHSHVDDVLRLGDVTYMHVNSASYFWMGSKYRHQSYPEEVHAKHRFISYTCPYRDSLFALLTIDPKSFTIKVEGRESEWVGKSPTELGMEIRSSLREGNEIAPRIQNRDIARGEG